MLVSSCMEDHGGAVLLHDPVHTGFITNRADQHVQLQLRIVGTQLLLNGISIVFVDIKDHQLFGLIAGNLTAQLAADTAAATGDHDGSSLNQIRQATHVHPDHITFQKILNIDIPDGLDAHITIGQLIDTGHLLELTAGAAADVPDFLLYLGTEGGNGQNDLGHIVLVHRSLDGISAADDGSPHQLAAFFGRIIVHHADHLILRETAALKFPQNQSTGLTGTNDHGTLLRIAGKTDADPTDKPIEETDDGGKNKQQHGKQHREAPGHFCQLQKNQHHLNDAQGHGADEDPCQFVSTGKAPQRHIQLEGCKHCQQGQCVGDRPPGIAVQKSAGNAIGEAEFIANKQCQKGSSIAHQDIQGDQQDYPGQHQIWIFLFLQRRHHFRISFQLSFHLGDGQKLKKYANY